MNSIVKEEGTAMYESVTDIIKRVTGRSILSEDYEEKLTGPKYKIDARNLVYVMLEIMDFFNIEFLPQHVLDGEFNSVESIVLAINKAL